MKRRVFIASAGAAVVATAGYLLFFRNTGEIQQLAEQTCSYCGMKIERKEFAAEMVVDRRRLMYDDIGCMLIHYLSFKGEIEPVRSTWPAAQVEKVMVYTFDGGDLVEASAAWFVKGSEVKTPMRHGYIAFKSLSSALDFAKNRGGEVFGWDKVLESFLRQSTGHEIHHHQDSHQDFFKIPLTLLDGKTITVSQLLLDGKPVLLVFFATWCPTCSKNIKTLAAAYPQFENKVTVLLTSFDPGDTSSKIRQFLEIHNAPKNWLVTLPNLEFITDLRVVIQETIFAINTKGEIIYEKRFGTLTEDDWLKILSMMTTS
ncbi:MAG: nitrous oxide reductase accessory protein NosL [Candidatus Caldarchaeum sp.]